MTFFHHNPVTWLPDQWPNGIAILNNLALITVATWGITGFSMVILSAALQGGRPECPGATVFRGLVLERETGFEPAYFDSV